MPRWAFWAQLKGKHPVVYEVLQWGVLVLAAAALLASFLH